MAKRRFLKLAGVAGVGLGVLGVAGLVWASGETAVITPTSVYANETVSCAINSNGTGTVTGFVWTNGDGTTTYETETASGLTTQSESILLSGYAGAEKGTTLKCSGTFDTGTASDTVSIVNKPLVVDTDPSISVSSGSGAVGSTYSCGGWGTSDAVDTGDSQQSAQVTWFIGGTSTLTGALLTTATSDTVVIGTGAGELNAVKDEVVTCSVQVSDVASLASDLVTSAVSGGQTVANSPPNAPAAPTASTSGGADGTATCDWVFDDPDGDTQSTASVEWYYKSPSGSYPGSANVTSAITGDAETKSIALSSSASGGEINNVDSGGQIKCVVTVDDGMDSSSASSDSNQASVANTAGTVVVSGVTASGVGGVSDDATCTWTFTDATDGDPQIYSQVDWYVGSSAGTVFSGSPVLSSAASTASVASGVASTKTESIASVVGATEGTFIGCEVTASDVSASTDTDTAQGGAYEVLNTAPSAPTATASASGGADGTATCDWTFLDADTADAQASASVDWYYKAPGGSYPGSPNATSTITGTALTKSIALSSSASGGAINNVDSGGTIKCTATVSDETDSSSASVDSNEASVANTVGTFSGAPTVTAGSDSSVNDTLTCAWSFSDSVDGDAQASAVVTWSVSGGSSTTGSDVGSASLDTATVASLGASKGQAVSCQVVASDVDASTDLVTSSASSSLTIQNAAPSFTSVSVLPSPAYSSDTLTCTPSGYNDVDLDAQSGTVYQWQVAGGAFSGSSTVATIAATSLGATPTTDSIVCKATPKDGTDFGSPVSSSGLTLTNTSPGVYTNSGKGTTGPALSTSTVSTGDVLTCSAFVDEIDSESTTWALGWFDLGGSALGGSTSSGSITGPGSVSNSVAKGTITVTSGQDNYVCKVTTGDVGGSSSSSLTASRSNIVPVASSVALSSSTPKIDDTVSCSWTYTDGDGDNQSGTQVYWLVDGATQATDSSTATGTSGSTASVSRTMRSLTAAKGKTVVCKVLPDDGKTGTSTQVASSAATVQNTAPVASAVSVLAASPEVRDTVSCDYTWADADNISPSVDSDTSTSFTWYRNGSSVSGVTTVSTTALALGADFLSSGDTLSCDVTPNDGSSAGSTVAASSTASVINSAPVATASITAGTYTSGSVVPCSVTGQDDNAQTVSGQIDWFIGSSGTAAKTTPLTSFVGGSTSATADSDSYTIQPADAGQNITCTVTYSDGTTSTSASSVVGATNTAPTVSVGTISPSTAASGTTLTCNATVGDQDAQTVSIDVKWASGSVGGAVLETESSTSWVSTGGADTTSVSETYVMAATDVETDVYCVVTAADSSTNTSDSAFRHSDNTDPSVGVSVSSSTGTATAGAVLTCTGSLTDPDSQTVSWSSSWRRNSTGGTILSSGSGTISAPKTGHTFTDTYTVQAADTSATDIFCVLTVTDDESASDTANASISTSNTAPSLSGTPSLSPSSPQVDDTVTCQASSSDPDGDDIDMVFTWTVDGSAVRTTTQSGSTGTSTYTDDDTLTLLSTTYQKGEVVNCSVTPKDSYGAGASSDVDETIANTPPVLSAITTTSSDSPETYFDSTIVLSYATSDWSDADIALSSDPRNMKYTWSNGGASLISSATTSTSMSLPLTSYSIARGDVLTCSVIPNDGEEDGTGPADCSITIDNKPPSAPAVSMLWQINPGASGTVGASSPRPAKDDLVCGLTSAFTGLDDEGDSVTVEYTWYLDGSNGGTADGVADLVEEVDSSHVSSTLVNFAGDTLDAVIAGTVAGDVYLCVAVAVDSVGAESEIDTSLTGSITVGTDCDVDNDGFNTSAGRCGGTDCDDSDNTIFVGAPEVVGDGIDQDCNGADECYLDNDGDGFASASLATISGLDLACSGPNEVADNSTLDCNDSSNLAYPGYPDGDLCDGLDNDCDTDGVPDATEVDQDGDGYVECVVDGFDCDDYASADSMNSVWASTWNVTSSGTGAMEDYNGGAILGGCDCDETTANAADVAPGFVELCEAVGDQIDSDCDGDPNTSNGVPVSGSNVYYRDQDLDGFGSPDDAATFCVLPETGYSGNKNDCNDLDENINPNADEICNDRDDNCNGQIDNDDYLALGDESGCVNLYEDKDRDGYGDIDASACLCPTTEGGDTGESSDLISVTLGPVEYISRNGDCYDLDADIFPGSGDDAELEDYINDEVGYNNNFDSISARRTEVLDGHDNNCDGRVPLIELDCDGDGSFAKLPSDDAPATVTRFDEIGLAPCWDIVAGLEPEDAQFGDDGEPLALPELTCGGTDLNLECDPFTRLWVVSREGMSDYDGGFRTNLPTDVAEGDCDDLCEDRYPGNNEVCDGLDNDCSDDAPNSDDDTPYYADNYNPDLPERLWDTMDRDGVPDAMDTRVERMGTVTLEEFDLDQDDYIGCGDDIGSLREQTIPTSATCGDEKDGDRQFDCNNTCALTTPAATEACNGFADTCEGDTEGGDADGDDAVSCGIGALNSGASLEEQVFVLAYIQDDTDDPSTGTPGPGALNGKPQGELEPQDSGWFMDSRRSNFDIVECDTGLMSQALDVKDVSSVVPLILPRAVAPANSDDWELGPDDIVATDQLLKQHLNALVGDENVDQAVRDLDERLAGRLSDRDPLLDFCACVNGFESGERDCDVWRELGQCVVLRVTLDPSADEDIDLAIDDNDCVAGYPEQVITRAVWNPIRILDARQRVVEWECMQLYGMTCSEIAVSGTPDRINFGGTKEDCENGVDDDGDNLADCDDPECLSSCVGTRSLTSTVRADWWLELGRHSVSVVTEGNLMGCWGDPTEGIELIESVTGGDCDDAEGTATRYTPEGPGDLYGRFWEMELDCSTCLDGVDNNCDGQADCADPGCAACFVGQGFGVGGGGDESCAQLGCSSTGLSRSQTLGGLAFAFLALGLVGMGRRRREHA